jgi:formylglycine-generating enzyme required for sulfatase activity
MSETQLIPVYHRQKHIVQCYLEDLPNNIQLKMVAIPAGSFVMGAPEEEEDSRDSDRPQHEVNVHAFWMGQYQVTQAQWKAVAEGLPQVKQELKAKPSHFDGDNLPVEQVSWLDAIEFCARLSVHTKREYRLPSEAEWEYACRAMPSPPMGESPQFNNTFKYGDSYGDINNDGVFISRTWASAIVKTRGQIYPPFQYGESITTDLVNYNGNYPYGESPKGKYRETTTEVGSFPPNAFGLYDMHGNVWEWCEDDWKGNDERATPDGRVWLEGNSDYLQNTNVRKLLRGGSWLSHAKSCRSACRVYAFTRFQNYDFGFRIACRLQ